MSENRSLSVLEMLVHLTDTLPDKFVLGAAEVPNDVAYESVHERDLPSDWQTLALRRQHATKRLGDEWAKSLRSAILLVPSVVTGERNLLINPEHPHFQRIRFSEPQPFTFDQRLFSQSTISVPSA